METRLSILFYGKSTKKNQQFSAHLLACNLNGQRFEVSTQRYIDPAKWLSQAGKVKGNSEDAQRTNAYLDMLRSKVYTCQRDILQNDEQAFNIETFKAKWMGNAARAKMFCEIFADHNTKLEQLVGKDYAGATAERYRTSLDHTKSFLKWKYGVEDIDIKKLDFEFVIELEFWLKSVRNCNHNTTMKYIGNIRKIVNICIRNGWLQKDPFLRL